MLRFVRDVASPVGLSVLALLFILGTGCDFFGGSALVQPSFEVSDGLADRITVLDSASASRSSGGVGPAKALAPSALVQVRPPTVNGEVSQASHLSYDPAGGRLYVGYKLGGDPFGGGIDVLNVQSAESAAPLVEAERSLQSSNVDVVEVRANRGGDALYAAGAVNTEKLGGNPAVIARLVPRENAVDVRSERLSDFVAKSVVLGPVPNTVHVITDEDALFRFNAELRNQAKLTVDGAAGFRSLVAQGTQLFVLDRSGRVYEEDANDFRALSEVVTLTENQLPRQIIARLFSTDTRLFAALNQEGFSIFSPTGDAAWTSERPVTDVLYTSVAVDSERLYVGRVDGVVEVYRLPAGIPASDQSLERIDVFGVRGGDDDFGGGRSRASINQVLVADGYLFVANSTEGVIVYDIPYGSSADSSAAGPRGDSAQGE